MWQWDRSSKETKKITKLDKDFQERLNSLQQVAYEEKVLKKQKSYEKFLEIVEKCKSRVGPITENDAEKLEVLSYEEVRPEVRFLKKTTAPQLRLKRKVEKKFINYTKYQLIRQMREVLTPRNDPSSSLGFL